MINEIFSDKVVVIAALLVRPTGSTPFKRCNVGISPMSLSVKGCSSIPCSVQRGSNVTAVVDFVACKSKHSLNSLTIGYS